jgi:hypothetical protein
MVGSGLYKGNNLGTPTVGTSITRTLPAHRQIRTEIPVWQSSGRSSTKALKYLWRSACRLSGISGGRHVGSVVSLEVGYEDMYLVSASLQASDTTLTARQHHHHVCTSHPSTPCISTVCMYKSPLNPMYVSTVCMYKSPSTPCMEVLYVVVQGCTYCMYKAPVSTLLRMY